ncbi:MAG: AbrB/MazE/SpoVT family DNA-binding domain-containing protein [Vulcanimicrobiota bacterium]
MIKTLTKHGNSHALILDRAIMELLEIDGNTPIKITTDGKQLILTPIREPQTDLKKALTRVNQRHGGALRRLAE